MQQSTGNLTQEVLEERLMEARRTYRLNMGYAGLTQLPAGFVDLVKKYNPHITELELSSNNLSDLPEELGELRYLRVLRVKYNQLRKIPPVVLRLPQLMVLELSGNKITRVDEAIGSCYMLRELDLSGNEIMALPDSICNLAKLESLHIENNKLEILPEALGELPSLIRLDLSTNQLRFLPATMGGLRRIQRIDAANNLLVRVPPSMGHLKTLKEFSLRYNSLDDRYKAKVEEGLSRLLAFLRDEEERERLEEIERLKPIGTPVGSYLEYRCKAETGQLVKTDAGEITVDNRPWLRSGHTLTQVGNMLVIFGGTLAKDGTTTSDVFWMTVDRMEWHHQSCKGDRPAPRYNHTAVYDEENKRLVIFGGRTAERKRLNDVYYLELDNWTWHRPALEGAGPTAREQAVSTFWAGSMVVFGGHAIGGRTNDLFLLDLSTWQWQQPATQGTAPSPRQACALCIGHGNLLLVHGGRNNFVLEDLHVLDFMSKTWTEIASCGRMPPPRHSHLITVWKDSLYLFGGLDELGAQSNAMYCLPLVPAETYATAKPEWVEWDSELPYNKNRTSTLVNGSLSIYQLGSNTLGRANDDDTEKGLVYWDVYKTARLEAMRPRQLAEEELRPKNVKRTHVQHSTNTAARLPRSFSTHTAHEAKVIAYVQDFQSTFAELYPHRRPLYLTPKNECGVPKLVCTTLRPTQLGYTELYDIDGAATFVADFLAFEALEDARHPPEHLPSPSSVLGWQHGDSFDFAVTLCSLLLGVGYNAYVVVGYAPQAVVSNDQTLTDCPVLEKERRLAAAKADALKGGKKADAGAKAPKYAVKPTSQLTSKVLKAKEEARLKAEAEAAGGVPMANGHTLPNAAVAAGAAAAERAATPPVDGEAPRPCNLVHAWVLVMQGKREVVESVFIEPSTGRKYSLGASPYEGIEAVWNHQNFWACMQMRLPHSDSRAHPKDISYDLTDPDKWEAVFEERGHRLYSDGPGGEEGELRGMESRHGGGPGRGGSVGNAGGGGKPKTPSGGMAGGLSGASRPGSSVRDNVMFSRAASRAALKSAGGLGVPSTPGGGGGDGNTPPRTAEGHGTEQHGTGAGEFDGGDAGDADVVPDMPPSWVSRLTIPRDAFDMRCPRGSKLVLYYRCQHELFALFGDCGRWDGMVEKVIIYADDDRTEVAETRESFRRRKDKLRERRTYPARDMIVEFFDAGSSFGLKDMLTVRGERREFNFYHTARLDGLERRVELEGTKLVETFVNRDDRLVYRSSSYAEMGVGNDTLLFGSASNGAGEDGYGDDTDNDANRRARRARQRDARRMLPISKMSERFSRDPALDADCDIAKRVYYLAEAKILQEYHYGENRITNSSRTFHKDGQSQIVQVNPLAARPQPQALLEQYQQLLQAEKDCMQAVRDSEWEMSEMLRTRTNQEQNITLEMPYYDIVRIKAEESEEEEEESGESSYDYLSPFLPTLLGSSVMGRDQALEVRERCLRALKDRLIERANIIQARLDEEAAALAKRQQNFSRDRDQMSAEEEEEYERAVEECMFRIHILEKRLKRHEEQALHKYYELDQKLRGDTRLAALLSIY